MKYNWHTSIESGYEDIILWIRITLFVFIILYRRSLYRFYMKCHVQIQILYQFGVGLIQVFANWLSLLPSFTYTRLIEHHNKTDYPFGDYSVWLASWCTESRRRYGSCPNHTRKRPPQLLLNLGNAWTCRKWCNWYPEEKSPRLEEPSKWNPRLQSVTTL